VPAGGARPLRHDCPRRVEAVAGMQQAGDALVVA
jgi:hypothetical protein